MTYTGRWEGGTYTRRGGSLSSRQDSLFQAKRRPLFQAGFPIIRLIGGLSSRQDSLFLRLKGGLSSRQDPLKVTKEAYTHPACLPYQHTTEGYPPSMPPY